MEKQKLVASTGAAVPSRTEQCERPISGSWLRVWRTFRIWQRSPDPSRRRRQANRWQGAQSSREATFAVWMSPFDGRGRRRVLLFCCCGGGGGGGGGGPGWRADSAERFNQLNRLPPRAPGAFRAPQRLFLSPSRHLLHQSEHPWPSRPQAASPAWKHSTRPSVFMWTAPGRQPSRRLSDLGSQAIPRRRLARTPAFRKARGELIARGLSL